MSQRKDQTDEIALDDDDGEADGRAFALVHEVLEGRRRFRLDARSSKTLRVVLAGDTDTLITGERFVTHRGAQKQRKPSSYFRRTAPRVVSHLLDRAGVASMSEPIVIGLPAGVVEAMPEGFPQWSYEPRLVWIMRAKESVKILVRSCRERWHAPFVQAVQLEGPLAARELPEWEPRVVYEELGRELPCPRCGAASTRYRSLGDALVCGACGRSFRLSP